MAKAWRKLWIEISLQMLALRRALSKMCWAERIDKWFVATWPGKSHVLILKKAEYSVIRAAAFSERSVHRSLRPFPSLM